MKLFIFIFLFISSTTFASAELVCQGKTQLASGIEAKVMLHISTIKEGEILGLFSPITSDEDAEIQLTIQNTFKTKAGVRVLATYDRSNYTALMTFELQQHDDGSALLLDFKGFEGAQPFGPSKLVCK